MAHLVPSIAFVQDLKSQISCGRSLPTILNRYFESSHNDSFSLNLSSWWLLYKNGNDQRSVEFETFHQKALVEILNSGLEGSPIFEALELLEQEMLQDFEQQWKAYLESLPSLLSLPLLFLFFPSYLILLFGPLITQFLRSLSL